MNVKKVVGKKKKSSEVTHHNSILKKDIEKCSILEWPSLGQSFSAQQFEQIINRLIDEKFVSMVEVVTN